MRRNNDCFGSVTQHQANTCSKHLIMTICCDLTIWAPPTMFFWIWDVTRQLGSCTLPRTWMKSQKCVITECFRLSLLWLYPLLCDQLSAVAFQSRPSGVSLITESFRHVQTAKTQSVWLQGAPITTLDHFIAALILLLCIVCVQTICVYSTQHGAPSGSTQHVTKWWLVTYVLNNKKS